MKWFRNWYNDLDPAERFVVWIFATQAGFSIGLIVVFFILWSLGVI